MKIIQRIVLLSLVVLFLGLTSGVELYSVHCNMRGQTFVSLQSGLDPCLTEINAEDAPSCCSAKTQCPAEKEKSDKDGCCDEEEIHLSYEPDSYSQIKISIPNIVDFLLNGAIHFHPDFVYQEQTCLAQFPQPPPLQGRQILAFNCIWRI